MDASSMIKPAASSFDNEAPAAGGKLSGTRSNVDGRTWKIVEG
jgi:hypothetical protein